MIAILVYVSYDTFLGAKHIFNIYRIFCSVKFSQNSNKHQCYLTYFGGLDFFRGKSLYSYLHSLISKIALAHSYFKPFDGWIHLNYVFDRRKSANYRR